MHSRLLTSIKRPKDVDAKIRDQKLIDIEVGNHQSVARAEGQR